jgi:hypothetical protein
LQQIHLSSGNSNISKSFKYSFGELDLNHPFDDDDEGFGMHEDDLATSSRKSRTLTLQRTEGEMIRL